MTVEDYKSKEIGLVCDLLVSMKLICTGCGNQFTLQVFTISLSHGIIFLLLIL